MKKSNLIDILSCDVVVNKETESYDLKENQIVEVDEKEKKISIINFFVQKRVNDLIEQLNSDNKNDFEKIKVEIKELDKKLDEAFLIVNKIKNKIKKRNFFELILEKKEIIFQFHEIFSKGKKKKKIKK
jgi:hypothetical protein